MAPAEFHIDFSSVRHLTPQEFVEKLSKDLGVRGVVAGKLVENFDCILSYNSSSQNRLFHLY